MPEIIIFLISLGAIIKGANWLGEASVNVAKKLRVPHIVIGATLVSVATTLPETLISFFAGREAESGISIGTVIGSPAINLGLIVGLIFLFGHQRPVKGYFTRTLNIFIFLLAVLLLLGIGGSISPIIGWVLVGLGLVYLAIEFFVSKNEEGFIGQIEDRIESIGELLNHDDGLKNLLYFVVGAILLGVGAKFFVDSVVVIAAILKIPTILIAVFVIALGTSLPELANAISSIRNGRLMLSIGNLVGASILDLTIALGAGAVINPIAIPREVLLISLLALLIISILGLASVLTRISVEKIGAALIFTTILFALIFASLELNI